MEIPYGNDSNAFADQRAMVVGDKYRITVLTERMVRIEYSPDGCFVDQQTQTVLNRRFPVPEFRVNENENQIEVTTSHLIVSYDKNKPFSSTTLNIQMIGNPYLRKSGTWFYGDSGLESRGNLKGTASTLDNAVGNTYYKDSDDETKVWGEPDCPVELCEGLMSKNGFSIIDDSNSLVFGEDGWVHTAPKDHQDIYFLNYGRNYLEILDVFFQLTGKTPMLPRYALGNWWSRFHKYTQSEYLDLLERFRSEGIPISVGVLDMDWHYVDIDPKYGKGWTGYSWNKELFPNPEEMMRKIHENGMHFSLNVHPADGVRAHEDMYLEMAKELNVDYEHEDPIPFDVTSPDFMKAYFKYLHHPNEGKGVDFWWIDWQQGSNSKVPGYDPLWILNHYHYIDNGRKGVRPMNFSRYAGLGSHRYPIGFSGSTFITWESLDYQPYFTANATNVGYGWWSHDIGGHRNGYRDDELTTRWVQFGVFSPIMRLHSSDEVFTGKEPWKFSADAERVMRKFLTLRHQLIPYIYTMNHRFYKKNLPFIEPVYYEYPDMEEAYRYKNEYFFGSELLVNPVTSKSDSETRMGMVKTWLPEGNWFDLFTGMVYRGNRTIEMHRGIDSIPVLGKAGGIIPMENESSVSSKTDNPKHLVVKVFCGADGEFELYEDDGVSMNYENEDCVTTNFSLEWDQNKRFVIGEAIGNINYIPSHRDYDLQFYGLGRDDIEKVSCNSETLEFEQSYDEEKHILTVFVRNHSATQSLEIVFKKDAKVQDNNLSTFAYATINQAQIPFIEKEKLYRIITAKTDKICKLSSVEAMYMPEKMKSVIREILLAE